MEILILVLMGFVYQAGKADGENRPVGFYWGGAAVTMLIIIVLWAKG